MIFLAFPLLKTMGSMDEKCILSHLYGLRFYPDFENKEQLPESTNEEAENNYESVGDLLGNEVKNRLYCFLFLDHEDVPYFKIGSITSVKSLVSKIRYIQRYTKSTRIFPVFFCEGTLSDEREFHQSLIDIRSPYKGVFDEKRKEIYLYSSENYDIIKDLFEQRENFLENPFLDVHDNGSINVLLPPLTQEYRYWFYRFSYHKGRMIDKDNLFEYGGDDGYRFCKYYSNYVTESI